MVGLNWHGNQISPTEALNFAVLIPNYFSSDQVIRNQSQRDYSLRTIVCLLGRHNVVFNRKNDAWVLYDDTNTPQEHESWETVLEALVTDQLQPVLLVYETFQ